MGQAGEKWDMRLSWIAERTAPASVVAVPDVPQQVQAGPNGGGGVSLVSVTAGPHPATTGKD